jgi:hypothetical protein
VELDAGDARLGLHLIPEAQRCEPDAPAVPRERTPIKLSFPCRTPIRSPGDLRRWE